MSAVKARRAPRGHVQFTRPVIFGPRGAGSDATIPVPGTGTILIDADTLTVGAQTVFRPRDRIAGAGALELVDVKAASPSAALYGMVVVANDANLGATVTPKAASTWDVSDRAGRALGIVASITAAVDVSDRDPRLLGRVKNLDSGGAVIDIATKAQLPATLAQKTMANSLAVVIASDQSALPVTGVFWQATQPVSLAAAVDVSDRAARLLGVVYGSQGQQLKQTATNFNAQVEIAVGATLVDPRAIRALTVADIVGLGAGTAQVGLVKISDGTDTALVTTGGRLNVQSSVDGLVQVMYTAEAIAGIIAETAVTLTLSRAFAATSTGTSFGPTAGKNLRIWGFYATWVSTTTTANTVRFRIRVNASGAATTASPLQFSTRIGWESATFIANEAEMQPIMFPNPIEIPSGGQFMLTQACVAANGTFDITLLCDEYTP